MAQPISKGSANKQFKLTGLQLCTLLCVVYFSLNVRHSQIDQSEFKHVLLLLQLTVYESLIFSARLRFNKDVEINTVYAFVQEVMELVELEPLAESLVGAPGVTGLSVEQRKRLTIAVELVANPSIVFMDEPTSGESHGFQRQAWL
jgi:ABC-type branched-subunit amino acid transport system ATPase component